jgi:thioesterase domain-containing protein
LATVMNGVGYQKPGEPAIIVPLGQRNGEIISIFVHSLGGGLWPYTGLVSAFARRGLVYGIRALGNSPGEEPDRTVSAMADRYAALISELPVRPDVLVGWSFGGLLAWETATRLRDRGNAARVVLVDSNPAVWPVHPDEPEELRVTISRGAALPAGPELRAFSATLDAHIQARKEFIVTRHYPGPVLLLNGLDSRIGQAEAWRPLAARLTVRTLQCKHFEFLSSPILPLLLRSIDEFLDRTKFQS